MICDFDLASGTATSLFHKIQPPLRWTPPRISPSSVDEALSSPRTFLLNKALGITPRYFRIEALARGTWFHTFLEHDPMDISAHLLEAVLRARCEPLLMAHRERLEKEWREANILGETRSKLHEDEKADFETMLAMYLAYADCRMPFFKNRTFREYLSQDFQILSREFRCYHPEFPIVTDPINPDDANLKHPAVCVFDMLLYNPRAKSLWVLDAKTTAESPIGRMSTCPASFQTLFMIDMAQEVLPGLIKRFGLDPETTVGGVIHLVFQKPEIKLSRQDCNFTIDTTPLKSGPRKGEPKNDKIYFGDPLVCNYAARIRRWILAEEEYTHLVEERRLDPTINTSHTKADALSLQLPAYHATLFNFASVCMSQPEELFSTRFPESAIFSQGRAGPYAPLLLSAPEQWHDILAREGYRIRDNAKQKENTEVYQEASEEFIPLYPKAASPKAQGG